MVGSYVLESHRRWTVVDRRDPIWRALGGEVTSWDDRMFRVVRNSDEAVSDSDHDPLYEVDGGLIDLGDQMGGNEAPVDGVSRVAGLVRNI